MTTSGIQAHFADRLTDAVSRYGPLCVGLDPRLDMLPKSYSHLPPAERTRAFCLRVLELVRPYCGVIKPQAAFFERLGPLGFQALADVMQTARQMGYFTIYDAKRGDISTTAEAYAEASVDVWDADSITLNPYLGLDAVEPFLRIGRLATPQRGSFILVRTSNPGGGLFQNLLSDGRPLYRRVAEQVAVWNDQCLNSSSNYGDVGAVVGATQPKELVELRQMLPRVWFLVPGYGAQGGTAADVKAAYDPNGLGAIVNSSRGVVFPFKPDDPAWEEKIVAAAGKSQSELKL